jgi:hypothetical protein
MICYTLTVKDKDSLGQEILRLANRGFSVYMLYMI